MRRRQRDPFGSSGSDRDVRWLDEIVRAVRSCRAIARVRPCPVRAFSVPQSHFGVGYERKRFGAGHLPAWFNRSGSDRRVRWLDEIVRAVRSCRAIARVRPCPVRAFSVPQSHFGVGYEPRFLPQVSLANQNVGFLATTLTCTFLTTPRHRRRPFATWPGFSRLRKVWRRWRDAGADHGGRRGRGGVLKL
jgi:hypothetical protein